MCGHCQNIFYLIQLDINKRFTELTLRLFDILYTTFLFKTLKLYAYSANSRSTLI